MNDLKKKKDKTEKEQRKVGSSKLMFDNEVHKFIVSQNIPSSCQMLEQGGHVDGN